MHDNKGLRDFVNNNRNVLRLFQFGVCAFLLVVCMHLVSRGIFQDIVQDLGEEDGSNGSTREFKELPAYPKKPKKSIAGQNLLTVVRGTTILCFGDSLTRGLFVAPNGDWHKVHPYSIMLNQLLRNDSNAVAAGVNGELTSDMVERLPKELEKIPSTRVVIILGGTNDLGHRRPPSSVIANIVRLHDIAQNHTSHDPDHPTFTVAVTIPMARWPFDPQARLDINAGIRAYAKSDCHVALLDLENYRNQSVVENAVYWSPDFVHFSEEGYDEIGRLVYEKMDSFILKDNCI